MKIVITQRSTTNDKFKKIDSLEQHYVKFFESFGAKVIPIPNASNDPVGYFQSVGATHLVFSGGGDIDPKLYSGKYVKGKDYAINRDIVEKKLLKFASINNIPVLGICRGCQFINIYYGGKMIQNINTRKNSYKIKHVDKDHELSLIGIEKFTKQRKIKINSFHSDGFTDKELAKNLKFFAIAEDGIIEGIYHKRLPIAGIMWHPERMKKMSTFEKSLINSFINQKFLWKKQ